MYVCIDRLQTQCNQFTCVLTFDRVFMQLFFFTHTVLPFCCIFSYFFYILPTKVFGKVPKSLVCFKKIIFKFSYYKVVFKLIFDYLNHLIYILFFLCSCKQRCLKDKRFLAQDLILLKIFSKEIFIDFLLFRHLHIYFII